MPVFVTIQCDMTIHIVISINHTFNETYYFKQDLQVFSTLLHEELIQSKWSLPLLSLCLGSALTRLRLSLVASDLNNCFDQWSP